MPLSPERAWPVPDAMQVAVVETLRALETAPDRSGMSSASMAQQSGLGTSMDLVAPIDPARRYRLDELIDIAQRNNPDTRAAWEAARQAGLAVGVARSTLFPRLAASAVGGYQRLSTPIQVPVLGTQTLTEEFSDLVPMLSLEWLLFDFGQREAAIRAARHLTTVANVSFNQVHQQLVFDVSNAFHAARAADDKSSSAQRAVRAAEQLLAVAEKAERTGLGNRIEVAQARQQLAQARLALTNARAERVVAQIDLNAALNLPQETRIRLDAGNRGTLPTLTARSLAEVIEAALSRRPDLIAAVAEVQAAKAQRDVAKANFLPKVGLVGSVTTNDNAFRLNSSETLGTPVQQTGILLGVTLPLSEGGLRERQLQSAESRIRGAESEVLATRRLAAREIAIAYEGLRSSLAAYQSVDALVEATQVGVDAARKGLEVGYTSLAEAAAAEKALMEAEELRADARRDAFEAAATLALVTGAWQ